MYGEKTMATLTVEPIDNYTDEVASFGVHMHEVVGSAFDQFQEHTFEYPGPARLTIEMLDHFAAGDAEADIPLLTTDFEMGLLALVKWWKGLQDMVDGMWYPYRRDRPPVPGLGEAENAIKRVRLALAAVITDTSEDENPLPEFLRSYRLWTRSICALGRMGWPGIDWSYLDQVV
jgi:hypothetical protein